MYRYQKHESVHVWVPEGRTMEQGWQCGTRKSQKRGPKLRGQGVLQKFQEHLSGEKEVVWKVAKRSC